MLALFSCSLYSYEITVSSSSVTIPRLYFDDLPNKLLVEIFKRLPHNLVYRYRCVSKRWFKVLRSENFIRCFVCYNTILAKSKPPFALFYQKIMTNIPPQKKSCGYAFSENPVFKSPKFTFDFLSLNNVNILSWSNDIILCKLPNPTQYCVCNPLTKQWITIPQPPCFHQHTNVGFICKSTSKRCSFRIVHPSKNEVCREFEVFESESKQWTKIIFDGGFFLEYFHFTSRSEAIACNGLLHWKNSEGYILVYDPYYGGDNYKITSVSYYRDIRNKNSTIGVFNERLMYLERDPDDFLLWELEDYDTGKWGLVQKARINKVEIKDFPWNINCEDLLPLAIHPYDEDVIFLLAGDQIMRCHMRLKILVRVFSLENSIPLLCCHGCRS